MQVLDSDGSGEISSLEFCSTLKKLVGVLPFGLRTPAYTQFSVLEKLKEIFLSFLIFSYGFLVLYVYAVFTHFFLLYKATHFYMLIYKWNI